MELSRSRFELFSFPSHTHTHVLHDSNLLNTWFPFGFPFSFSHEDLVYERSDIGIDKQTWLKNGMTSEPSWGTNVYLYQIIPQLDVWILYLITTLNLMSWEFIKIIWKLYYNYHTDTVQKRDLDLANRARTKNPGVRDEVLQETALGLIQREKYKRLCPQSPAWWVSGVSACYRQSAETERSARTANCHRGTFKYSVTQTVARCQRQMFDSKASRSRRG